MDGSMGMAVGMMVVGGNIVTEMEALKMLTGVDAIPIAGGGIDGGEGSRTFVLEGPEDSIKAARDLVCSVKGESALKTVVQDCELCGAKCDYNQR